MTTVTNLYKMIYKFIADNPVISKKVGNRIFSHTPDDIPYPLIRITDIHSSNIACTEYYGSKHAIKIEIMSQASSNLECLALLDNITDLFDNLSPQDQERDFYEDFYDYKVASSILYQDKASYLWIGEIEIEILSFIKH